MFKMCINVKILGVNSFLNKENIPCSYLRKGSTVENKSARFLKRKYETKWALDIYHCDSGYNLKLIV